MTIDQLLERARERQTEYLSHVREAEHCLCATGGLCLFGQWLDDRAEAAWQAVDRLAVV